MPPPAVNGNLGYCLFSHLKTPTPSKVVAGLKGVGGWRLKLLLVLNFLLVLFSDLQRDNLTILDDCLDLDKITIV